MIVVARCSGDARQTQPSETPWLNHDARLLAAMVIAVVPNPPGA